MSPHPMYLNRSWRTWVIQSVLLLLLAVHGIGLFHHHATADEHDACVACQVTDHQALDVPDSALGAPLALLVLLFIVASWHPQAPRWFRLFKRGHARAPPFASFS